ncbi:ion channel [Salinibius halmophilus]|uniref:ion channel n=1 Tax=Salinibius halmophilus TaxID=1853216 RepID=UPI000E66B576|nr:ion channel [Salinibius halmophilus]
MPMWEKIKHTLVRHLLNVSNRVILLAVLLWALVGWIGLWLLGEQDLLPLTDYVYWLMVTASTVGYGDMSPVTHGGKLFVMLYIIPFGLSLFALLIGRVAAVFTDFWRRGLRGERAVDMDNHILLLGWQGDRSRLLSKLIKEEALANRQRRVVLVDDTLEENPLPTVLDAFVKVKSFTTDEDMQKCNLAKASTIVIAMPSDNQAFTAALYSAKANPNAHLIVSLQDDELARMLRLHCPNAELSPNMEVEILVKAAMDPGSSELHYELIHLGDDETQYSVQYPSDLPAKPIEALFLQLKKQHNATILGVRSGDSGKLNVNPALDINIQPGDIIYYVASQRVKNWQW